MATLTAQSERTRPDRLRSGIALRVAGAATAAGIGICVHGAAQAGATTGQVVMLRSVLSIPVLVLYALLVAPVAAWLPRVPSRHLMRGVLGGTVMGLNFYALGVLPVAHAQALAYLAPVLSVPVAVALLGERLSLRAVLAVSVGCAGMATMLYTAVAVPGWGWAEATGMVAGIAGAALMAVLRSLIRSMTATETTISIALSFAVIAGGVGGLLSLWTGWAPMSGAIWAWMAAAGVIGAATHILATEASARAPVSVLAPYDYAGLVFAVALDALIFAHLPGPWGWIGIALIVAAGAMTLPRGRPEGSWLRLK